VTSDVAFCFSAASLPGFLTPPLRGGSLLFVLHLGGPVFHQNKFLSSVETCPAHPSLRWLGNRSKRENDWIRTIHSDV